MEPLADAVIAQQIVDDISGEFSSYTAEQLTPYVTEARLSISVDRWIAYGTSATPYGRYNLASKYLAMHIIASLRNGGSGGSTPAGPVTSRSAGELSESYASPTAGAYVGLYSTTGWGRRFAELLATLMPSATVV